MNVLTHGFYLGEAILERIQSSLSPAEVKDSDDWLTIE